VQKRNLNTFSMVWSKHSKWNYELPLKRNLNEKDYLAFQVNPE